MNRRTPRRGPARRRRLRPHGRRLLADIFGPLGRSQQAHVAVLTADGDRLFCGGADINESQRRHVRRELLPQESVVDLVDPGAVVRELFWGVRGSPLPVIAAVNGIALGAGVVVAVQGGEVLFNMSCSFHVAEDGPDVQLLAAPAAGDPDTLPRVVLPRLFSIESARRSSSHFPIRPGRRCSGLGAGCRYRTIR